MNGRIVIEDDNAPVDKGGGYALVASGGTHGRTAWL